MGMDSYLNCSPAVPKVPWNLGGVLPDRRPYIPTILLCPSELLPGRSKASRCGIARDCALNEVSELETRSHRPMTVSTPQPPITFALCRTARPPLRIAKLPHGGLLLHFE